MPDPVLTRPSLRFALTILDGRAMLAGTPGTAPPTAEGEAARPRLGHIENLLLEVPGLRFPFDLSRGPRAFQSRRCLLRELDFAITPAEIEARLAAAGLDRFGVDQVTVRPARDGLRLALRATIAGRSAELTAKVTLAARPGGLWRIAVSDARLHGFLALPAPLLVTALPAALGLDVGESTAAAAAAGLASSLPRHHALSTPPLVRARGATEWDVDVGQLALIEELVTAGYRLPVRVGLQSRSVEIGQGRLIFRLVPEAEVRAADDATASDQAEGVPERGLASLAEAAFCAGEIRAATEGFRRARAADPDNAFARERLLQLLASFPDAHEELNDLADATMTDRALGLALVAKATVAAEGGQAADAAGLYHRCAALAQAAGEPLDEAAARFAAAIQLVRSGDDAAALLALDRVLDLRPTHEGAVLERRRLQTGAGTDDRRAGDRP